MRFNHRFEIKNYENTICNFKENKFENLEEMTDFLTEHKSPKST